MNPLKNDILACLQELKGSGKFAVTGNKEFILPGLKVEGVGEVSFPVDQSQAEVLLQIADKAPFGKGNQTIYDDEVRSAREIDAEKLSFLNPEWSGLIRKIVKDIQAELGLRDYKIDARPYKLLIYRKGDFFLTHKDTEKEKGMFGTMIVGLPSNFTGGALHIRFEGDEVVADFAKNNPEYSINYAAFYADCDHEVKPLASGYRVCLVYNLIQQENNQKINHQSLHGYASQLADLITSDESHSQVKPYIILLGHQYTPENFSSETLKLNDRFRAEALMVAARKAGYYAKLCLVTSYQMGTPAYEGYYGYDDYDEDAEMGEVYDESLEVGNWVGSEYPGFDQLPFDEDDLIASFELDEDEPLVKENSGYMGNYGPDLTHWYHYGAVVIWSPQVNASLLISQRRDTQLAWIEYFNRQSKISAAEEEAVFQVLSSGLEDDRYSSQQKVFNGVADWLINHKNKTFLTDCSTERLQLFFTRIDTTRWMKLFGFLPENVNRQIWHQVTENMTLPVLEKVISMIYALNQFDQFSSLRDEQLEHLPGYFNAMEPSALWKMNKESLSVLFRLAHTCSTPTEWAQSIGEKLSKEMPRTFVHNILAPALLENDDRSTLTDLLQEACLEFLQHRADHEPEEPQDWRRPLPEPKSKNQDWDMIREFMESPGQRVFDYQKKQADRTAMEYTIKSVTVDLKLETIRKGSPHTLRLVKTKDAYLRAMKKWHEDVALLDKIKRL